MGKDQAKASPVGAITAEALAAITVNRSSGEPKP